MRRWIASVDNIDALSRYAADAAAVTGVLMAGGVGALATCRALTGLHDALTVRLIELAEAQLGPAPCRYAWLALGSGGRMEQSLCTDQDHAIVYADDGAPDRYFGALGAHVVAGLARAGLRRCPGGYMADRWHLPLARWREVFRGWVESPEPLALVEAELLLDFRRVAGELSPVPLDAVSAASLARATPDRLAAASAAGTISLEGAAVLADAYRFLAELRLRAQLRQVADGIEPTNRVRLADLTADERKRLRRVLKTVRELQRSTELRFHTHTVL